MKQPLINSENHDSEGDGSQRNEGQNKSDPLDVLRSELGEKNEQISQLHQLVAMSQKHSDDLLEDLRKPRSWWNFWQKNGK